LYGNGFLCFYIYESSPVSYPAVCRDVGREKTIEMMFPVDDGLRVGEVPRGEKML
jgi:hypothetical protein